ncbi:hypothetical protein OG985_23990 [Streptomyces sp. NBC_00289]|uniref:hypothetical protein n=1 Tax=Streptomyces sp. NBC_00289 TaxID=2975703 RepID=UPI003246CC9F
MFRRAPAGLSVVCAALLLPVTACTSATSDAGVDAGQAARGTDSPAAVSAVGRTAGTASPAATDPAATDPAATDPAGADPAATDPAATQSAATQSAVPPPSLRKAPEPDAGQTLAGRRNGTNGNGTFSFDEGRKGDALSFEVRCLGKGRIEVRSSIRVSFGLECLADEVSTVYNQFDVTGVDRRGTVSVVAPSTVRWAMTVSRGEAAQVDGRDGR